jgi:hypothetical protein
MARLIGERLALDMIAHQERAPLRMNSEAPKAMSQRVPVARMERAAE